MTWFRSRILILGCAMCRNDTHYSYCCRWTSVTRPHRLYHPCRLEMFQVFTSY